MSYCKLYIDTVLNKEEVNKVIDEATLAVFQYLQFDKLNYSTFETFTFKNESYDDSFDAGKIENPTSAKFYVELGDGLYDNGDTEDFIAVTIGLIVELRKILEYVVASCEFEDIINAKTGWNWTKSNPFP